MNIVETELEGLFLIEPVRFEDERGFFSETFKAQTFRAQVADVAFVQDNHSLSRPTGTLRGLHFQRPPFEQGKLVRCVRGAILDVAVDLRGGSPTLRRWLSVRLDATTGRQIYVPPGFAHGFVTLEPDTEVIYKVTAPYSPAHDAGVAWNDPDLAVEWGVEPTAVILSAKDARLPRLKDIDDPF